MSENTNKELVGQPILPQKLELVSKVTFRGLVKEHKSDRYYKKFNTWTHFVSLMYGIFSRCDSVTEIIEGMIGCVGKIGHFGLSEIPPKSTILSSSRTIGLNIKELFIVDSTTIQFFSNLIFNGVGRDPKGLCLL